MAEKKRITDVGLLLYFNNYEQLKKIDSKELGELIKKEMEWQMGLSEEPVFEDVRCDCFHSTLKAEAKVRDGNADRRNKYRKGKQEEQVSHEEPQVNVQEEPIVESVYEPTYDDCLETLQMIYNESGDGPMEAQANKYSKMYGFSVKEMCVAVRGR